MSSQRSPRRATWLVLVIGLLAGSGWASAIRAPASWAFTRARFIPPVPGAIVDGWRPPASPYAAGNRGIDLDARPGDAVFAVADGVVTFAGQVGGPVFVVTRHVDPVDSAATIRITVGFLRSTSVRTGQVVNAGQPIGIATGPVHVGLRRATTYDDPRSLFARSTVRLIA